MKVNIFNLYLKSIFILIWTKLIFSYLSVKLTYFQKGLIPNVERFNFLGLNEDFSKKIEYILLPISFYFVFRYFIYAGRTKVLIIISLVMFFLNIITGIINDVSIIDSLNYSFKIFSPIYLFCSLVIYNNKTNNCVKPYMKNILILCVCLTIIALLFFAPSFNRMENYLPIYFDGIHTHNYVLVSVFIGIVYLLYKKNNSKILIGFIFLSILFLYFGYNVRTTIMMYLIFVITVLFLNSNVFKVFVIKALVLAPFIILLLFLLKTEFDLNEFSSGRTSMYVEKIKQLSTYNLTEWLFGRGYESDLIVTEVWWWDKKGAHNDLFTFLVENGILYMFMLIYLFYKLVFLLPRLNIIFISIVIGCFFTSMISNGIITRPLAGYVLFIVLAYIYIEIKNKQNESIDSGRRLWN